jgi:DNA-directed RNA polymerase specialized sigma24 family protein
VVAMSRQAGKQWEYRARGTVPMQTEGRSRSAVRPLLEGQRRAIQAVYREGRTDKEAAEALGIPLRSLKRSLRLGLV